MAQIFPGRIVQLTPEGDPAGPFPLPRDAAGGFLRVLRAMGDETKLVVAGSVRTGPGPRPGDSVERTFLHAYDPEGRRLAAYHDEDHVTRYGGMHFREPEFTVFEWRWALAPDGRVVGDRVYLITEFFDTRPPEPADADETARPSQLVACRPEEIR